ncbi:6693_t:CDS:2, partial [Dentiscutata erythropus]
ICDIFLNPALKGTKYAENKKKQKMKNIFISSKKSVGIIVAKETAITSENKNETTSKT